MDLNHKYAHVLNDPNYKAYIDSLKQTWIQDKFENHGCISILILNFPIAWIYNQFYPDASFIGSYLVAIPHIMLSICFASIFATILFLILYSTLFPLYKVVFKKKYNERKKRGEKKVEEKKYNVFEKQKLLRNSIYSDVSRFFYNLDNQNSNFYHRTNFLFLKDYQKIEPNFGDNFIRMYESYENKKRLPPKPIVAKPIVPKTIAPKSIDPKPIVPTTIAPKSIDPKPIVPKLPETKQGRISIQKSKTNKEWEEVQNKQREIGAFGELKVLNYEKYKLKNNGLENLIPKVEHVSKTKGDGLGYDILSFDEKGNQIHIEVKATFTSQKSNFEMSTREYQVMNELKDTYFIARVYNADMNENTFQVKYYSASEIFENHEIITSTIRIK